MNAAACSSPWIVSDAGSHLIARPSRAAIAAKWQVFMAITWLNTSETGRPPARIQR